MIIIYGAKHCSACESSKSAFKEYGIEYEYVDILDDTASEEHRNRFFSKNFRTVPQLFEGDNYLGDFGVVSEIISSKRTNQDE